jgi:hypothetical protein
MTNRKIAYHHNLGPDEHFATFFQSFSEVLQREETM